MSARVMSRDQRGEALSAAILFVAVLLTVLIGIHVVLVAMARAAVQSAADAAVAAAQAAGPGPQECDGDEDTDETVRECAGVLRARRAMAASGSAVVVTRPPAVDVRADRGVVSVIVFGGTLTPVLGGLELAAQACGPLDDVPAAELTDAEVWQC